MQEFDFGYAASRPGFRLHVLEVYNWGTFNRQVWQLRPEGATTLLTGPNGSGKTTVVDALVTLLTPPTHRHYNQSSGAEAKRDRTQKSYLEGAYGTGQDADTGTVTPQVLRPGTGYYSWLAASFQHEDLGQALTLVQYRRYRNGELVTHFLILPRVVSLRDDQALQRLLADEPARWREYLRIGGEFKEHTSFEQYAAEWQHRLGVRSDKALTLFSKTVGLKMLGSLDEFVRREMLSDAGGQAAFQELYEAYRNLLNVFHLLQKAQHQLRLLQPVVDTGAEYRRLEAAEAQVSTALEALPEVFGQRKKVVLQHVLMLRQQDKAALATRQQELKAALDELKPLILELELTTRSSEAGRRLQQLADQLAQTAERLREKHQNHQHYSRLAQNAGLAAPTTVAEFQATRQAAQEAQQVAQADEERQDALVAEQTQAEQQAREQRQHLEQDLTALRAQRTLIPREMTELRQRLCEALDLSPAQVPFIGELLRVKPTEARWRAAIEKLLHGSGLQLLVLSAQAADVNRYVHDTNLRGRLVYHRVEASRPHMSGQLEADALRHKLEIADKPPFTAWLDSHLYQHYNYCCTDDPARLNGRDEPLLLTSAGLIRNRNRHEKDDRPGKAGARYYVLGWDNEEKIAALEGEVQAIRQQENAAAESVQRHRQRRQQLRERQLLLGQLLTVTSFDALDWSGEESRQQALLHEQATLQRQRDQDEVLRQAQAKLLEARAQEAALEGEKEQVTRQQGGLEQEVEKLTKGLHREMKAWPLEPAPVPPGLWSAEPPAPASPEEADHQQAAAEKALRIQQTENDTRLKSVTSRLMRQMGLFRNPDPLPEAYAAQWKAECSALLAAPESLADYETRYQQLREENLPQYQQQFQRYLTGDVLQFVFKFQRTLDQQYKDVKSSIQELNEALMSIDYSRMPRTYIRLKANEVRDGAAQGVAAWRARLKQALPNQELLATNDSQQAEVAFSRLRDMLDELNRDEAMRRKVLDVRNWLQFGAEEVARDTEQVVNVYSNSGGRSGGEKAKLTYTVLAAAIAYQYNAMRPGRHLPSFRFVVIDETFSKSDATNSTYALKLFAKLGLQLMIVTPSDNIPLAAPFIEQLHLVRRLPTFESEVWNLSMEQYLQQPSAATVAAPATAETQAAIA